MSQHKSLTIQSEGFPATIETWNVLNESIQHSLDVSASIIGSNAILSGCTQYIQNNETYVSDGIITINKEVFAFKGGKKSQGVTIIIEKISAVYDTNSEAAKEMLPVYQFSYATNAGSGQSIIPWDSFVRVSDLKELSSKVDNLYSNRILETGVTNIPMLSPSAEDRTIVDITFKNVLPEAQYIFIPVIYRSAKYESGYVNIAVTVHVVEKFTTGVRLMVKSIDRASYEKPLNIDWCVMKV